MGRHGAGPAHRVAILAACFAGAAIAAVAGVLKATVGAHEVITTIMLNWIAYWVGELPRRARRPAAEHGRRLAADLTCGHEERDPADVLGQPGPAGAHVGLFVALAALVVFWIILSRTTLGFQVRAVGFNPEAARYGGISVARNYVYAMAISGAFAGLGGAVDVLGWQFQLGVADVQASTIGFIGIAVALLGRNTAVGVGFAALLFGALINGSSTRGLDPTVFPPSLASNLTLMIQALVLLFVGADVLVLGAWGSRKRMRLRRAPGAPT